MKRTNFFLIPIFLLVISFTGCKSLPTEKVEVNVFDILDKDSSLYLRIPVANHKKLTSEIISSAVKNCSLDNSALITSNIDTIYAGFSTSTNRKRVQIASSVRLPAITNTMLTKAGWKSFVPKADELSVITAKGYKSPDESANLVLFPLSQAACFSDDTSTLVENYLTAVKNASLSLNSDDQWHNSSLYSWITEETPNVRFYLVRPQNFLSILLGTELSSRVFKLLYTRGEFEVLEDNSYNLTLELEFLDSRLVKPAVAFIEVSLGLTDAVVSMESATHVKVSNIHLQLKQFLQMLGY